MSNPNIKMVETVIDNNKDFLNKHKHDHEMEIMRHKRDQAEIDR